MSIPIAEAWLNISGHIDETGKSKEIKDKRQK
jgi:hypothetical protein